MGVFARTPLTPFWVVHVCTLFGLRGTDMERQPYIMLTIKVILILNFKLLFELILNGNFLRLMYLYTTSDVYLTLRFNFEIEL